MAIFNAFQIVTLFASMPFIIGWLGGSPFPYSVAAFWIAIVVYIVMFVAMVASVADSLHDAWK
jgi:ABC-type nitrate/sulfonate/bicarbonate transport system permease component